MRVVVRANAVVTDRSGQNASDYWVHHVPAGVYPLVWVDRHGRHVPREQADRGRVTVPSTIVESGGVSRLLGASRFDVDKTHRAATHTVSLYPFQSVIGMRLFDGDGEIEAGVSLVKTGSDGWAEARCARNEVVYRRGMALRASARTVSLNHPRRRPQRHAHIPGEYGMHQLPAVWLVERHCDCRFHRARRRRKLAAVLADCRVW